MMLGQTISQYKIIEKLGEGGMGVVYKAHDTKLNREVALKFLPPHIAQGGTARDRFVQEAQAAAAINHPNICVIYEINDIGEQPYIAMEYVDGSTIRTKLESGPMRSDDAIKYAIQIGEALHEAHRKGIVHRDIKADNIIINSKGQAKVMDFGLAKLKGTIKLTRTSSTVGTLGYMAPEQIQGGEVDARSDIFAFAVLFFEMLTGRLPFRGEHEAAMVYSIVNEDPEPIQKYLPEISPEIIHTLSKALEKNPEDRYQSIQDMVVDLRRSKKDSTRVGRLSSMGNTAPQSTNGDGKKEKRSSKNKIWIGGSVFIVVLIAVAIGYFLLRGNSGAVLPPMKTIAFTSYSGVTGAPAISPEGNAIAFVWNGEREDNFDIYVKLIDAGTPLRLTNDPAEESDPAWSPDGKYIAFSRTAGDITSYYIIPSLGGNERKLAEFTSVREQLGRTGNGIDWSPDGSTLAVSAQASLGESSSIILISVETGSKKKLTSTRNNNWIDYRPKFSPDGSMISFSKSLSAQIDELYTIPIAGGEEQRLTFDNLEVGSNAWTEDGKEIIFSSNRGGNRSLWRIPSDGGTPVSLTNAGENIYEVAIGRKGNILAYSRAVTNSNLWRMDLNASGEKIHSPVKFISSKQLQLEPQYSPDGKFIAYASNRSGSKEIWVCNNDGTNSIQLTFFRGPAVGTPRWSPDSRFIAFDSREKGNGNIYVISSNGGKPRQLTSGTFENNVPSWSRDGKWIYYSSNRSGAWQIWKSSVDGSQNIQVTQKGGFLAFESFDGAYLYFVKGGNDNTIFRQPLSGGEEEIVDRRLSGFMWGHWELTDKGIYFVKLDKNEHGLIYFYNFATKQIIATAETEKRVWPFSGEFTVSPDGRSMVYTQVDEVSSDIMLIQNFQ